MTPAETAIRAALAAGPTPGPWSATCRDMSYVEGQQWPEDEFLQWEVEGPRPVWGRGDYVQADAKLIAACSPAAMAELLAELDRLRDDLTRERNRSQMFAELVRGVAVVLHGPGYSDTSKLPAEVEALKADAGRWRSLYRRAVNVANGLTNYVEERPELRRAERELTAIESEARAAIDAAKGGGNG
ncbi:hypothetical protein UFOVP707_77 [uncultured Caudovirales phage]|uniref:Uncharacterized protein n=1 Tax=uncultured Caudovirales phage TaxID=2100421 RepID=A0A6J5NNL8_9CAUD|nr:hypothetical protein UFOVP707_77 [uncultured Caudovirales phage]